MKRLNHKASLVNRLIVSNSEYSELLPYIIAQARHESANFSSAVYRANNNPFGMKVPSRRPFLGTQGTKAGDGGFYARYENDTEAFRDLLKWMRFTRMPTTVNNAREFAEALKARKYYTDTVDNYTKAIERWMKRN